MLTAVSLALTGCSLLDIKDGGRMENPEQTKAGKELASLSWTQTDSDSSRCFALDFYIEDEVPMVSGSFISRDSKEMIETRKDASSKTIPWSLNWVQWFDLQNTAAESELPEYDKPDADVQDEADSRLVITWLKDGKEITAMLDGGDAQELEEKVLTLAQEAYDASRASANQSENQEAASQMAMSEQPETAGQAQVTGSQEMGGSQESVILQESETAQKSETSAQSETSRKDSESLAQIRSRIQESGAMFGMAYIGYVGESSEEGFARDISGWMKDNAPGLLQEYPFIAETDEDHIIGDKGCLYSIVPLDEKATVAINHIQWNEKSGDYEPVEVIYRSETGEPVLLFANLDGVAYEVDTQVFITDSDGHTCQWYPSMDAMSYLVPGLDEKNETRSVDFTDYGERR